MPCAWERVFILSDFFLSLRWSSSASVCLSWPSCVRCVCACLFLCALIAKFDAHIYFSLLFLSLSSLLFPSPFFYIFFNSFNHNLQLPFLLHIPTTFLHVLRLLPSLSPQPHQRSRRSLFYFNNNRFSIQSRFHLIIVHWIPTKI